MLHRTLTHSHNQHLDTKANSALGTMEQRAPKMIIARAKQANEQTMKTEDEWRNENEQIVQIDRCDTHRATYHFLSYGSISPTLNVIIFVGFFFLAKRLSFVVVAALL